MWKEQPVKQGTKWIMPASSDRCWRQMDHCLLSLFVKKERKVCSLMGTISSQNLQYADIPFWNDSRTPFPTHHWDLQNIAVWNTQARLNLNNRNPEWLNHLAQITPEAKWNTTRAMINAHIGMLPLGAPPPGFKKFLKSDHLLLVVAKRHNHDTSLHPGQTSLQV